MTHFLISLRLVEVHRNNNVELLEEYNFTTFLFFLDNIILWQCLEMPLHLLPFDICMSEGFGEKDKTNTNIFKKKTYY